jgi:hypothetical protein
MTEEAKKKGKSQIITGENRRLSRVYALEPRAGFEPATCRFLGLWLQGGCSPVPFS